MDLPVDELPLPQRLAASYAPAKLGKRWRAFLLLDARLAGFVANASEPMLAQMRLAWWRDMLAKPIDDRPQGDPLLEAIGALFEGRETQLTAMVDGWERIIADPPLTDGAIDEFADGRATAISAISAKARVVSNAARAWALTDLAVHTSDPSERFRILARARGFADRAEPVDRDLRPLAVLFALARRSLRNGGTPLLQGRSAILLAFRVGLFGR